jgi:hypothetical protein
MASKALVIFSVAMLAGCGSSATPPDTSAEAAESPAAEEPATEPAASEPEKPEAAADDKQADPAADPATAEREVTYLQTPDGLKIDVGGVRFSTSAKPVKAGGGWGVALEVQAVSHDGKPHKIMTPKNGPLAFGGKVNRSGNIEELSDKREGEEEQTVAADKPFKFSREWPAKGGKGLAAGDALELQVGLWGVGDDSESRRPVRNFVLIKMVAGKKKPQPVVLPPTSATE